MSRDSPGYWMQQGVTQVMNDLLMITKVCHQMSRMILLIIITAGKFLASKNQIQLVILEFGDLDH